MNFCEAREQWMANDEWPFADRDAAWNYFFTAGMIAEHELNAASREELARLRERCKPSKVVMIGDAGHYVSEAVGAEIDRLRFTLAECKEEIEMSVKQENRYRKLVISQGQAATDRQREIEAACMVRGLRKPAIPPPPSARRRDVRAWMRHNAEQYETATELAEAANAVFRLPDGGLDDETHWVWDEAAEAIDAT